MPARGVAHNFLRAMACLQLAIQLYPDTLLGTYRVHMKTACNITHNFHYLSGRGDPWMGAGYYSTYNCFRQHAWLDAFYTALRGRIRTKDWYVIDIGGNLGQEPILAAMHHFHTYTFEPFPENVESLNFNAAMNCAHERVTAIVKGTSSSVGTLCFKEKSSARIRVSHAGTSVKMGKRLAATAKCRLLLNLTTLDIELTESFDAQRKPLLLKIDNEGSELATLQGASTLLATQPPLVVIFESITRLGTYKPCVALLHEHGYSVFSVSASDSYFAPGETPIHAGFKEQVKTAASLDVYAVHMPTLRTRPEFSKLLGDMPFPGVI